jgi:hypothetical protein
MGLDNMPTAYPCRTGNTAVLTPILDKEGKAYLEEDGSVSTRVDCGATQAAGGCPYKNARKQDGMDSGEVHGMFGTDCWYRGKYGNHLIRLLGLNDDEFNFYGENDDGTHKTPAECMQLAEFLEETWYEKGAIVEDGVDLTDDVRHAIWYLRWCAKFGVGMDAWY